MIANANRQIVLAARPEGAPKETDFRLVEAPVPEPAEGELLVRTIWLSLDPYMRLRMGTDLRYYPPIPLGDVIVGGAVSRVVESRHPGFEPGDIVDDYTGWQDYAIAQGASARKVDPAIGAALDRRRCARHAGAHRLSRPRQGGPARAGGHGGGLGGSRRGGRSHGPGGEDCGLPRGRHRGRGREAAVSDAGARLRRGHRPPHGRPTQRPCPSLPGRYRRLLRECRRAHRRCDLSPARPRRPRRDLRRHFPLQRDRATQGREPPRAHPLYRDRGEGLSTSSPTARTTNMGASASPAGSPRGGSASRKTSWRGWRMRRSRFSASSTGATSASCWSESRRNNPPTTTGATRGRGRDPGRRGCRPARAGLCRGPGVNRTCAPALRARRR